MIADCAVSGKRGYATRREAKTARQQLPTKFKRLRVYRCGDCGSFHLGHLPLVVLTGAVPRGVYYDAVRERAHGKPDA